MDNIKTFDFNVNAFQITAGFYQNDIDMVFIPLLHKLYKMKEKTSRRLVVFLAGPPGAGKTTLSLLMERLGGDYDIQAAGIDGFH